MAMVLCFQSSKHAFDAKDTAATQLILALVLLLNQPFEHWQREAWPLLEKMFQRDTCEHARHWPPLNRVIPLYPSTVARTCDNPEDTQYREYVKERMLRYIAFCIRQ